MKKIHFEKIGKENFYWIAILIISIVLIISGTFEFIEFENTKLNKFISSLGFLLQSIYFSKMFWFKNYVQWNKKGIFIRTNYWTGKSFKFSEISEYKFSDKLLVITTKDNHKTEFQLHHIFESDILKLRLILTENITGIHTNNYVSMNIEKLESHDCNLNIRYDLPKEIWDKIPLVYEKMDGWLGFGEEEKGQKGIPYWFGYYENEKSIFASVEPSGLQFEAYNMEENELIQWKSNFKQIATEILGFKVGEIEEGEQISLN